MVVIRLARGGAKKAPFYKVVVTNKLSPRDGRFIERVGFYNPSAAGQEIGLELDMIKIQDWISKGAQPSETVAGLLKRYRKEAQAATKTA
jgi:small subunit ribosomal protein S16